MFSPEDLTLAIAAVPYTGRILVRFGPRRRRSSNKSWICNHFPYFNPGLCYTEY